MYYLVIHSSLNHFFNCFFLEAWFATEMGESLIPDRFVDIFQGRAPRSVLAKHYTGNGLERLKRIYDKADLKVLG